MKLGLAAASLILVAGGAVGCGGDGGAGEDAPTTDEFCGALKGFQEDFTDVDATKDLEGYIQALKDAADELEDTGVPDDMPDDAEDGFDITIKAIQDLPDDATLDDLGQIGEVSEEDQKKIDALDDYISEKCPDLDGETDDEG
jgi:hypothetical protein